MIALNKPTGLCNRDTAFSVKYELHFCVLFRRSSCFKAVRLREQRISVSFESTVNICNKYLKITGAVLATGWTAERSEFDFR
jgi:hypothetical protein